MSILTLDKMLNTKEANFPIPGGIIHGQTHHKALRADEDIIIFYLLLELAVEDESSPPIYSIICQIAVF